MIVEAHQPTTDRDAAVAAVHALHNAGRAATLYSFVGHYGPGYVALDLDAPVVDVVDALSELGLADDRAQDEGLRLVARGF